jgi:hypothetical protein
MNEWETQDGVKKVADALRGTNGLKVREGVELGKRIQYFKGSYRCISVVLLLPLILLNPGQKLIDWLLESENPGRPDIDDEKDAIKFARLLLRHQ